VHWILSIGDGEATRIRSST